MLCITYIDEAQHLAKLTSGRRLQDQMDALKSLANRSHTLLVLIGTYELLSFHQLSGQLSRRSFELHFPRYGTSAGELKAFQSAIYAFQCQLPLIKAPELSRHWEYIYARSVGCIGILKDWLIRSLSEAYDRGEKTITLKLLQECAMSIGQCEQMAIEAREGEERIREGTAGGAQRLIQILGLTPGTRRGRPVAFGEAQEGIKPGSRIKRRVGRRNPKRDDVA
jgi:hypothetical protein